MWDKLKHAIVDIGALSTFFYHFTGSCGTTLDSCGNKGWVYFEILRYLRNVKLCTPTGIGGELIFDATGIYAEFKLIIDFDGPQRPRK